MLITVGIAGVKNIPCRIQIKGQWFGRWWLVTDRHDLHAYIESMSVRMRPDDSS